MTDIIMTRLQTNAKILPVKHFYFSLIPDELQQQYYQDKKTNLLETLMIRQRFNSFSSIKTKQLINVPTNDSLVSMSYVVTI